MTVLEAIQERGICRAEKVSSRRVGKLNCCSRICSAPRMKLYLKFQRVLTPAETDALREFITRRGEREPLQHSPARLRFAASKSP